MTRFLPCLLVVLTAAVAGSACAAPGDGAYDRVIFCKGPDATMEIFIPSAESLTAGASRAIRGLYALDLSKANKGKPLEPVILRPTADGKAVMLDQYTRGLPPTRIPLNGGTVDFDRRFGTKAICKPAGWNGVDQED